MNAVIMIRIPKFMPSAAAIQHTLLSLNANYQMKPIMVLLVVEL